MDCRPLDLVSWHASEYSLLDDDLDWARSSYYRDFETIRVLYSRLSARVGTKQMLWCEKVARSEWHVFPGTPMIAWFFRVSPEYVTWINKSRWSELVHSTTEVCRRVDLTDLILLDQVYVDVSALVTLSVARRGFWKSVSVRGDGATYAARELLAHDDGK